MDRPPCIEHAIQTGPEPDEAVAWILILGKWLKKEGVAEQTAPLQLTRWLNASDSMEDLDDEDILAFCKTAYMAEDEISCNKLMVAFPKGCAGEACPLYVRPVVPLTDGPTAKRIYLSDESGSVGVDEDGTVKAVKSIATKDGSTKNVLVWLSDCMVYVHTETIAERQREFIFQGVGAADKIPVKFCLPAEDLAEPKKFRAALINSFGAANRVGNLTFEIVQQITKNTIKRRRLLAPAWVDGKPMVPGLGLADDIEFRLLEVIPAMVYDGDLAVAKVTLGKLLDIPGPTPILVTAILGSPIYARWFLNDRFGVGMWGLTGSLKTSITKKAMSVYGIGYNDDANLLKHGKIGSTSVGAMEYFVGAGILPQILDNVKSVNPKDVLEYVGIIHAVIEGREKARGKKDGGLRKSKEFLCTPIVTGEIKPDEASTSARILNLKWREPDSKAEVDYVQAHISNLPVIGYHWLRFLAGIQDPRDGFDEVRSCKTDEFNRQNYVNSGRLATIYALLRATWNLLCRSPFADVFEPRTERFLKVLDEVSAEQGAMVSEETEVAKFMRGIASVISAQPHLIQQHERQMPDEYGKTYRSEIIGRWMENGDLFLIPDQTLRVLKALGVFSQIPTIGSITDALAQSKCIETREGKKRIQQRVNDARPRGWLIPKDKLPLDDDSFCDTENGYNRPVVTKSPPSQPKINESFQANLEKSEKKNEEIAGDNGDKELDIDKNKEVDSDDKNNILSHTLSPVVTTVTNTDRIRTAALLEYGIHGWVEPRKLAAKLGIELSEVVSWLDSNYEKTSNGYTQHKYNNH